MKHSERLCASDATLCLRTVDASARHSLVFSVVEVEQMSRIPQTWALVAPVCSISVQDSWGGAGTD